MRAGLNGREFALLVNWCEIPPKKHERGGIQDRRARWLAQLAARNITGKMVRAGEVPADDRYIDLDDGDIEMLRQMRTNPSKGGWQKAMFNIFGSVRLP